MNIVHNKDCMIDLVKYNDNHFDLAIVDPEFGINISNSARLVTDKGIKGKDWDKATPPKKYFTEMFRISKHQIVWGGNYFNLGTTKHCIIWDKKQPENLSFGMFDFAWSSFNRPNKIFSYHVHNEKFKIHPTQKPVKLYEWLLINYAKEGNKILDTHVGSGSSRIACDKLGFDFVGYEIDQDYFNDQEKRFKEHKRQLVLNF